MRCLSLLLLATAFLGCAQHVDRPGSIDGETKVHRVPIFEDGKIVKFEVYDPNGQFVFTEISIHDKTGNFLRNEWFTADGKKWPHAFPVFGTRSYGGLDKFASDIAALSAAIPVSDQPISEIFFRSRNMARVETYLHSGQGWGGSGYRYEFRKIHGKWRLVDTRPFYT